MAALFSCVADLSRTRPGVKSTLVSETLGKSQTTWTCSKSSFRYKCLSTEAHRIGLVLPVRAVTVSGGLGTMLFEMSWSLDIRDLRNTW